MCTYTDKPNIEIRNHRTDSRPTPPKRHYPTTEMTTKDRETVRTTDRPTDIFTRYDLTTERRTETKNHTMLNIGDARESECIHIMPIFYVCWCWIAHVCMCVCVYVYVRSQMSVTHSPKDTERDAIADTHSTHQE